MMPTGSLPSIPSHSSRKRASASGRWRTEHVVRLIQEQHGNVQLSLKVLSADLGVSTQHLGRVFRHTTGVTFRTYLRGLRVEEAKRLLVDPTLSVKEIAVRLGYSEPSTFVKDFKLATGSTPVEYRCSETAGHSLTPIQNVGQTTSL